MDGWHRRSSVICPNRGPPVRATRAANAMDEKSPQNPKSGEPNRPRRTPRKTNGKGAQVVEVVKTLGQVAEYWLSDPQRALELQTSIGRTYLDLWSSAMRRMTGEPAQPVAEADPKDRRFADPEWSSNQFFDFLKQA